MRLVASLVLLKLLQAANHAPNKQSCTKKQQCHTLGGMNPINPDEIIPPRFDNTLRAAKPVKNTPCLDIPGLNVAWSLCNLLPDKG